MTNKYISFITNHNIFVALNFINLLYKVIKFFQIGSKKKTVK